MATRQFVTFRVGKRLMGVEITQVREVNRALDITPVPHARAYVRGLINLRGQIVTILDLGARLGLGPAQITPLSHNLVLKSEDVGLLVDDIGEVVEAEEAVQEGPPANLAGLSEDFVERVVKLEDQLLLVLSLTKVLALD